jgi:hypothetical protein
VTLMEKNPDKVVSLAGRMESTVDAESIRAKVVPRRQKPAVGLRRVGDFRESKTSSTSKCLEVCFARWLNPAQSTYRQDANVSTSASSRPGHARRRPAARERKWTASRGPAGPQTHRRTSERVLVLSW